MVYGNGKNFSFTSQTRSALHTGHTSIGCLSISLLETYSSCFVLVLDMLHFMIEPSAATTSCCATCSGRLILSLKCCLTTHGEAFSPEEANTLWSTLPFGQCPENTTKIKATGWRKLHGALSLLHGYWWVVRDVLLSEVVAVAGFISSLWMLGVVVCIVALSCVPV